MSDQQHSYTEEQIEAIKEKILTALEQLLTLN